MFRFLPAKHKAPTVTRDDILWCYRSFLNREPESEAAIATHAGHRSLKSLIEVFIGSDEYRNKRKPAGEAPRQFLPLLLPRTRIDVELSAGDMARAIAKVKAAWTHLGEVSPHHSVITDDRYRPENLNGSIEQFWSSGRAEAERVVRMIQAHGVSPQGKVCVEYGCGVGRVTWALAKSFGRVVAYDISANHLKLARERVAGQGLQNVTLVQCADSFLENLQLCDVFYSQIVFQHNPPPIIAALIRSALKALNPGGIAIFQVPTYCVGYSFDAKRWLEDDSALNMEMHCIPQTKVFEIMLSEGCIPLEVREDGATGDRRFLSNTFVLKKPLSSWTSMSR